jgi:hypothetical protein
MPDYSDQGFFFGDQDFKYFQYLNQEFVEDIVSVDVVVYKINPDKTDTNLYGEAEEGRKVYDRSVALNALIQPQDQQTDNADFTFDVDRPVTFGFQREVLKKCNLYPQRGDVIEFDDAFHEITEVVDNELLGSKYFYRHSIVCQTSVARDSNINLIDRNEL